MRPRGPLGRRTRLDSRRRCATCSTSSWRSFAAVRPQRPRRATPTPRRPTGARTPTATTSPTTATATATTATTTDEPERRPTGDRRRRPASGQPRRRRAAGGPDDGRDGGGPRPARSASSSSGSSSLFVVIMLFSFGLDLWTDAIWYTSVGFDDVFWTRLGAQVGLFVGRRSSSPCWSCSATSGSPAGCPPPGERRPAARSGRWIDRLNEAAEPTSGAAGARRAPGSGPAAGRGPIDLRRRRHARPDPARPGGPRRSSRVLIALTIARLDRRRPGRRSCSG